MTSSMETVKVGGSDMGIYLGMPHGNGPFPAVVVSQAAGGVDEFIQSIVDQLAAEGYAAAAPELYHRTTEEIERTTGKTRRQLLDDMEIVADIDATVSFLQSHPSVNSRQIGVTGFCMGGRVAWLAAVSNPNFKVCVPFYGGFITDPWGQATESPFELSKNINCPMMFHFGEVDRNPSLGDMAIFDEELTRLGKAHEFHVYPGADHRFLDHTYTAYQEEASRLAWARTLNFLAANLKG